MVDVANKRIKETTAGQVSQESGAVNLFINQKKIGVEFLQRNPNPSFLKPRLDFFDQILAQQKANLQLKIDKKIPIKVTLHDGKIIDGIAFETTPRNICNAISNQFEKKHNICCAKVQYTSKVEQDQDGLYDPNLECVDYNTDDIKEEVYDLHRPLEGDCIVELVNFEEKLGKSVFWHSSAHILGAAIEKYYGSHLCIGPPLNSGFYYDSYMGEVKISESDYLEIEKIINKFVKENYTFEKVILTKKQALELFKDNPFKVSLIQGKIKDDQLTSAYKCGDLIDLCTGPHLSTVNKVKAFKITSHSSCYWLGDNKNDSLQRLYGISFSTKKELDEWVLIQEELKKRDHRHIGTQYQLFMFHPFSAGSCFFYPKGAFIYNKLQQLIRNQGKLRGYTEVITPNMYNSDLWKISGHWGKYITNMFQIDTTEGVKYALKPMNCPGHCLMFDSIQRSYKDLPIRYMDLGVVHRNELHGALSGLTRVRRFVQDDAHIFCRIDQIEEEIMNQIDFIDYVYSIFGFTYKLFLSTRPKDYLGTPEMWDNSEEALRRAIIGTGKDYKVNIGDGAFYGPKIDIILLDAFSREYQCATIQLDFNLPIRFNLQYRTQEHTKDTKIDEVPLTNTEKKEINYLEQGEHNDDDKEPCKDLKNVIRVQSSNSQQSSSLQQSVEVDQVSHTTNSVQKSDTHDKKLTLTKEHELKKGFARPVIVHRAVLGSFERFLAILCESTAGKFPLWISPNQIAIVPISKEQFDYAEKIADTLRLEGFSATVDITGNKLDKKIRNAQLSHVNYIAVVGKDEVLTNSVNIRERDTSENAQTLGKFTLDDFIAKLHRECQLPQSALEKERLSQAAKLVSQNKKWNEQLKHQNYFNGFKVSDYDQEVFKQIENVNIDKELYPNLYRFQQAMKSLN